MSTDGQRIKWRRNIDENFNRLSRVHERYKRQTDCMFPVCPLCCFILISMDLESEINDDDDDSTFAKNLLFHILHVVTKSSKRCF